MSRDTLPCGSDAHHVRPSRRATAFIVEGSEAQLLSYMLKTAWYGNLAQSGRDLDLASSLPEHVSPFDWPRWLLPPASHTVSHRGKPPPRCPPQHPMQPNLPQNPRTGMHQPLQIFISPLSLGGPIVDEDFSPSTYAVSKPISIAYARTRDAFLMSRLVWPAGICVACSICAAISQHTHPSVCRTTPHDLFIAHRQTRR